MAINPNNAINAAVKSGAPSSPHFSLPIIASVRARKMIPRTDLPEDASEWRSVGVHFEPPLSCPTSEDDVFEYVKAESGDSAAADRGRLQFVTRSGLAINPGAMQPDPITSS